MDTAFDIATEFLTDAELDALAKHLDKYKELHDREEYQKNFLKFVKHVWHSFITDLIIEFLRKNWKELPEVS